MNEKQEKKEEIQVVAYLDDDGFCKLLNHLIEQQNISATKLCEGLCSESMLSKIRKGESMLNKLMRDRLLARVYSNMGEHEKAIELSGKAMKASLECGRLNLIEQNVDCISWNRMWLQKKGTSAGVRCDRKTDLKICIVMSRFVKEKHCEKKLVKKLHMLAGED